MEMKQIFIFRKDIEIKQEELLMQSNEGILNIFLEMMEHKSLENGYKLSMKVKEGSAIHSWLEDSSKCSAMSVNSEEELINLYLKAIDNNLPVYINEKYNYRRNDKVKTSMVIGPCKESKLYKILGGKFSKG